MPSDRGQAVRLFSRLTLVRNFANFVFPSKMEASAQRSVFRYLEGQLKKDGFTVQLRHELSAPFQAHLLEQFWLPPHDTEHHTYSGYAYKEGSCLVECLMQDVMRLHLFSPTEEPQDMVASMVTLRDNLGEGEPYAFDESFGYLTADPQESGAAFFCAVALLVPALAHFHELEEVVKEHGCPFLQCVPLLQGRDGAVGNIVLITNKSSASLQQEQIHQACVMLARKLQQREAGARARLAQHDLVHDRVSQSFGLCQYARTLSFADALELLSWLAFGSAMGWIQGVSWASIQPLFCQLGRGSLVYRDEEKAASSEALRASRMRKAFAHSTLHLP